MGTRTDKAGSGDAGQRVERLERELGMYRRLYRGALELLKDSRRAARVGRGQAVAAPR